MKKFLLLIATFAMAACSSDYDDAELRGKIDDLDGKVATPEQQIAQLQKTADRINDDIAALQAIANGIAITGVEAAADGGYTIHFSNGESYTIANGAKGDKGEQGEQGAKGDDAANPMFRIDVDGYWQISFDGTNWEYPNGQKISALGQQGAAGETGPAGQQGLTPRLSVDEEGYWTVSYDGGTSYERLKDAAGEEVKAVNEADSDAATGESYTSVFASAQLSEDGSTLEVMLAGSTETISLPVGGGTLASLTLDGEAVEGVQTFAYNQTRIYTLAADADYVKVVGRPDGWEVAYDAPSLTVTAPAAGTRATADSSTDVSLLVVLKNGLSCVVRIQVAIDETIAPAASPLAAPALTAGTCTATSITVNWTLDPNASAYAYRLGDEGAEQTLGKVATVTVTDLTAETSYTVYIRAVGDGTTYTDSEWASIAVATTAAGSEPDPEPEVQTLTLDAAELATQGIAFPTGSSALAAQTEALAWNYLGIGFESRFALSTSADSSGTKVPVMYLYKNSTANGDTYVRNTLPLGELLSVTVNLIDNGSKKGNLFTMTETVNGAEQTVLSSNDNATSTEHVYTFSAGNNGIFAFTNSSTNDCKVVSIVIEYKK